MHFNEVPELRISGNCRFVNSSTDSLTFTWSPALSATRYRLVGHGVDQSSSSNTITVFLRPGARYTFTVWAIGQSSEHVSNNITCINSTGGLHYARWSIALLVLNFCPVSLGLIHILHCKNDFNNVTVTKVITHLVLLGL